jgi:hypothetical protein
VLVQKLGLVISLEDYMSIWPQLAKFLFSLLGAVIGGSFVAWIGGYYSEKGKRDLFAEEFPKLLAEAREKAYAEETGKRLATKDDIENVLDQVRAVTRETELVKAEISGGLWQQQWQKTQKRDAYVRLIDTLENLQLKRGKIWRAVDADTRTAAEHVEQEAIEEFRRARALARLLLASEVIDAIGPLLRGLRAVDLSSCSHEEFHLSKKLITDARDKVVEIGRSELGMVVGGIIE